MTKTFKAKHAQKIPLWIKILFTLMVFIIVPIYWIEYGPQNFLWLSDIGLFLITIALWTENKLIASMLALGVLPLEVAWTIDIITGGKLLSLAAYMFDDQYPIYLRILSFFHIPLLITIIYMVIKLGYDKRALFFQTNLILVLLPLTYLLTEPGGENINWVYGLGDKPQTLLDPMLYLGLLMIGIPILIYVPMHFLLKRIFKWRNN